MRVFGIDPGSVATGFAVLRRVQGRYILDEAGVIRTRSTEPIPERLHAIHSGLAAALAKWSPDCVAIEAIFRHRSSESALRLGQARGVALLAAAQAGLAVSEYNAMTVKKTIGGHGRAGKPEMQLLVARLLGLDAQLPTDATDAVAIAMTHLGHAHLLAHARTR